LNELFGQKAMINVFCVTFLRYDGYVFLSKIVKKHWHRKFSIVICALCMFKGKTEVAALCLSLKEQKWILEKERKRDFKKAIKRSMNRILSFWGVYKKVCNRVLNKSQGNNTIHLGLCLSASRLYY